MEDTEQVNVTEMQERVRNVFEQYPETKNCIHKLYWRYWQMYDWLGATIDYDLLITLTPAESISRAGRFRQNHVNPKIRELYAPTEKIKRLRKGKQNDIHTTYKNKKTTIFGGVKRQEVPFGG